MQSNTETIAEDNGIEINVSYEYEIGDSQIELGHGIHEVGFLIETDLKVVEVIIKGIGIDILPLLNKKQRDEIISKLNYE